jgi:DNA-directed RNA polymerase specialized sigma24 family protein
MSAALQLPVLWGSASAEAVWTPITEKQRQDANESQRRTAPLQSSTAEPDASLAFYRKHTESMLRRYLYASMQVGRAPEMLANSVGRGWVSSRPVRTFEDAVIFVLDIERCLDKLSHLDREMLSRIVLQEYTQTEAADLIGMGVRTISYKFPQALDRLTQLLLDTGLLVLPH